MKQCPYCGKEYSDDMALCPLDRQPLAEVGVASLVETANVAPKIPARKSEPYVPYPEYRWSQRDAWKFLGMYLVFGALWSVVTNSLDAHLHPFYLWTWSPFGVVTMAVLYAGLCVLTAAYFARTETFTSFCKAMGLDRRLSKYVWFGVVAAVGIQFVGYVLHALHLVKLYSDNYEVNRFDAIPGAQRYLYLFPVLFAPFWEEPVNRGFLYKSFRGSYSAPVATSLIVAWTALTHWNQYRHFGWGVIDLSAWTVLLCYLREKSDSLWDCIWCHFAFNAFSLILDATLR